MSVVDQLKNMFAKKVPDSEEDSRLSLAMPDAAMEPGMLGQIKGEPALNTADESDEDSPDLIALPILGKKTVVQHQRMLSILLGLALVFKPDGAAWKR